jgi:hypothetical protein
MANMPTRLLVLALLSTPVLAQPYDPYSNGKDNEKAVMHGQKPQPAGTLPGTPPVPTQSSPGNGVGLIGNDRPGDNDNRPDGSRNIRPGLQDGMPNPSGAAHEQYQAQTG